MKRIVFFLSLLLLLVSMYAHVLSITDLERASLLPFMWLHGGVFLVWLPAMYFLNQRPDIKAYQDVPVDKRNAIGFYKMLFARTPMWLQFIAGCFFVYGMGNFFYFFLGIMRMPPAPRGSGELMPMLRMFSGHWMIFYAMAAAICYPFGGDESDAA